MAPLIPIALQLAQFAPHIMRFFGADSQNTTVAEKVVSIAQTVAGVSSPEEVISVFQRDQGKRHEFNMALLEREKELENSYFKDLENARQRDAIFIEKGTRNYRADFMFVLAVLVVVGIAYAIWNTPGLDEHTKGVATLILGRFLGYLDNIYNFEFGSTRSSKQKDSTIEKLSKDRE